MLDALQESLLIGGGTDRLRIVGLVSPVGLKVDVCELGTDLDDHVVEPVGAAVFIQIEKRVAHAARQPRFELPDLHSDLPFN